MSQVHPRQHPAWYGAVMGTGAVALALDGQAAAWPAAWLNWFAVGALLAASVLAVVLLPRYTRRLGDRIRLAEELADPARGALLATLPAGLLVLAAAWGRVGPTLVPAGAALAVDGLLLVVGTGLAVAVGVGWSTAILRAGAGLEGVNGGWVIPPVMNLLVPLALAPLVAAVPAAAPGLVLVGLAFYGIGVVLFLAMLTLLVARLALRPPPPAAMAPTLWIPLAPAGMVGLALLRLQQAAAEASVPGAGTATAGVVVSAMGLGFGLWWAVVAGLELRQVRAAGGPPVHPGWWGFVFPIGAMTLATTAVGEVTDIAAVRVLGTVATVLLLAVWALVLVRTLRLPSPPAVAPPTPPVPPPTPPVPSQPTTSEESR
jgi:C4-dicarboxylate transporter/malic acid transport protein